MRTLLYSAYTLLLALWTGGIALFTFIVTPAIFRSYGRDMAGEIVGRLFPGYFLFCLVVSAAALVLFFLVGADQASRPLRASLFLLVAAVIINAYVLFSLHPRTVAVKQQVATFEQIARESYKKERETVHGRYMDVFVKDGGRWLFVAWTGGDEPKK